MNYLSKILTGFAYGTGFSIAVMIAIYGFGYLTESLARSNQALMSVEHIDFVAFSDVQILSSAESVTVAGTMINESNNELTSITLEIELFDEMPQFVTECTQLFKSGLRPKGQEHFSMICPVPDSRATSIVSVNPKVVRGVVEVPP